MSCVPLEVLEDVFHFLPGSEISKIRPTCLAWDLVVDQKYHVLPLHVITWSVILTVEDKRTLVFAKNGTNLKNKVKTGGLKRVYFMEMDIMVKSKKDSGLMKGIKVLSYLASSNSNLIHVKNLNLHGYTEKLSLLYPEFFNVFKISSNVHLCVKDNTLAHVLLHAPSWPVCTSWQRFKHPSNKGLTEDMISAERLLDFIFDQPSSKSRKCTEIVLKDKFFDFPIQFTERFFSSNPVNSVEYLIIKTSSEITWYVWHNLVRLLFHQPIVLEDHPNVFKKAVRKVLQAIHVVGRDQGVSLAFATKKEDGWKLMIEEEPNQLWKFIMYRR